MHVRLINHNFYRPRFKTVRKKTEDTSDKEFVGIEKFLNNFYLRFKNEGIWPINSTTATIFHDLVRVNLSQV